MYDLYLLAPCGGAVRPFDARVHGLVICGSGWGQTHASDHQWRSSSGAPAGLFMVILRLPLFPRSKRPWTFNKAVEEGPRPFFPLALSSDGLCLYSVWEQWTSTLWSTTHLWKLLTHPFLCDLMNTSLHWGVPFFIFIFLQISEIFTRIFPAFTFVFLTSSCPAS